MPRKKSAKRTERERASYMPIPAWWVTMVTDLVKQRGLSMVALGEMLAEAVKRPVPWSYSTVSRFLDGKGTTKELSDAFLALFKELPMPAYFPEDVEEAIAYNIARSAATARRAKAFAERETALRPLDAMTEGLPVRQPDHVESGNEQTAGDPRLRGRARPGRRA